MQHTNKKKVRIAHLTPTYFSSESIVGGGERYVNYIVKAVDTAAIGRYEQIIISTGEKHSTHCTEESKFKIIPNVSPISNPMSCIPFDLRRELRNIDLVHVHQALTTFGAFCILAASQMNIPVVATDLGGGSDPSMLQYGLSIASGVVAISEYSKHLLDNSYRGDIISIIGPVDTEKFKPTFEDKDSNYPCLCVSRLLPHKGIDRVIEILPQGLGLTVVGSIYNEEYFEHLQKLSEGKTVNFITKATDEDLIHLYSRAKVFIQPSVVVDCYGNQVSKSELMGLTTLESLACGTPTIVSDTGSLPELVNDDRIGRVYSTQAQLSEFLHDIESGEWPSTDCSKVARDYVLSRYSFEVVGSLLIKFYDKLLGL